MSSLPAVQWRPLGELLVADGAITAEELDAALSEQERTGKRLGAILVDRGWITGPRLARALAGQYGVEIQYESGFGSGLLGQLEERHRRRRQGADPRPELSLVPPPVDEAPAAGEAEAPAATPAPASRRLLGELLVAGGAITTVQLDVALAEQDRSGKQLGRILVDLNWITGARLARALASQYGVEMHYEGGFGSGLLSQLEQRHEQRRQDG